MKKEGSKHLRLLQARIRKEISWLQTQVDRRQHIRAENETGNTTKRRFKNRKLGPYCYVQCSTTETDRGITKNTDNPTATWQNPFRRRDAAKRRHEACGAGTGPTERKGCKKKKRGNPHAPHKKTPPKTWEVFSEKKTAAHQQKLTKRHLQLKEAFLKKRKKRKKKWPKPK